MPGLDLACSDAFSFLHGAIDVPACRRSYRCKYQSYLKTNRREAGSLAYMVRLEPDQVADLQQVQQAAGALQHHRLSRATTNSIVACSLPLLRVLAAAPAAQAPECFDARVGKLTDRLDVFSFGVLLWVMITRAFPWQVRGPRRVQACS